MFKLISSSLENSNLRESFPNSEAGAFVNFEGRVRDHNDGKKVVALEYEAFEKLCLKEAEKIFQEVRHRFDVIEIICVHRVGRLKIGEIAVWVGVSAPHRESAFQACRYIIDEIKKRLPIWKKEYFENGESGWVNCECQGQKTEGTKTHGRS